MRSTSTSPSTYRHVAAALLVAVIAAFVPCRATAAKEHPSLLFSSQDIPAIRATLAGPLRGVRDALEAGIHYPFAGGNFPKTPNLGYEYFSDPRAAADSLLAFAFGAAVLDPATSIGREARELAVNYLRGICSYNDWVFAAQQGFPGPDLNSAHFLSAVAFAYDWLYPILSESDKNLCRNRVAIEGEKMYQGTRNMWWVPEYMQNHNWINTASLGLAALAFEGEISANTNAWLTAAKDNMAKVKYVLDLIEGGTWHEGTGYLHYGFDSLIPFSVALDRLKGGPDFADNQIVRDFAKVRMHMMPPSLSHRREHVQWGDFSGLQGENALLPLFYAGRKWRDGEAMWYAQQFASGQAGGKGGFSTWPPSQKGLLLAVPLYDATVPATPPADTGKAAWELDYYAHDLSLFTSRSGWEDGGSLLALKNGVFGGWGNFERMSVNGWPGGYINFGHDHADDMGVHFFADGEWLTTRVPGYFIGKDNGSIQANRTKYANSLLVDGIGQLGEGVRNCHMGSCPWFFSRQGTIPLRGSTANHSYALAAGSKLYDPALGLWGFGRSVLFVDRKFPVVRDVIQGAQSRRYEIVWHALDGAYRDGGWLRLNGKNDRSLGIRVVAPANFEVRSESQNAVHLNKFDPDGWMTALMVRPATQGPNATFLSALVPVRGSKWGTQASVEPIDPSVPERGLVIDGLPSRERYEIVFNDQPEDTSSAAGLTVRGMAGLRKLQDGVLQSVTLAAGTRLVDGDNVLVEVVDGSRSTIEVQYAGREIHVSGDEKKLRLYAPEADLFVLNGREVLADREGAYVVVPGTGKDDGGEGGAPGGGEGGAGGDGEDPCAPAPEECAEGGAGGGESPDEGEGGEESPDEGEGGEESPDEGEGGEGSPGEGEGGETPDEGSEGESPEDEGGVRWRPVVIDNPPVEGGCGSCGPGDENPPGNTKPPREKKRSGCNAAAGSGSGLALLFGLAAVTRRHRR